MSHYPYYIYAPDYRETSAGIVVLHQLCHFLNESGYEAYVLPVAVNPKLRTPVLSADIVAAHVKAGRIPITIYPEVVSGNPLNAPVCVRYILNTIGFLTGKPLQEGEHDLIYYYSENFLGGARKEDVDFLLLPVLDTNLFKPAPEVVKDKTYVLQYRFPLEKIDFSRFPPGTELISMRSPVSLPELAAKLQRGKVLYSYEISSVCTEAMMCGCPVVYLSEGGLKTPPDQFLFGTNGATMDSEKNGLARAAATVGVVHPIMVAQMNVFWTQLPSFVKETQDAVRAFIARTQQPRLNAAMPESPAAAGRRVAVLSNEQVGHPVSQARFVKPFASSNGEWNITWAIRDDSVDLEELRRADLIVMHRLAPCKFSIEQLQQVFALGKPLIYETDEWRGAPSDGDPSKAALHDNIEYVVRHAQAAIVATEALATRLRAWNPAVHVLPNDIDFELFFRPVRQDSEDVRVGLSASALAPVNFALVEEALRDLLTRYAGRIQLFFFGAAPPEHWANRAGVTVVPMPASGEALAESFKHMQLDIGLLPLAGSDSDGGVAAVERLAYAAAGVAVVCSDEVPLGESIRDGYTGVRVAGSGEPWVDAITRLIEQPQLRRGIARTAQAEVLKSRSLRANCAQYRATYLACATGGDRAGPGAGAGEAVRIPGVLILDAHGDVGKIRQSLEQHARGPHREALAVVLTTTKADVPEWTTDLRYLRATDEEYPAAVQQVAAHAEFDWKIITEAGARCPWVSEAAGC